MSTPAPKRRRVDNGSPSKPVRFTFDAAAEPSPSGASAAQAQIGAKTGAEDAAASDLSSSAAAPVPSTAFTMGVTPAASLSHGDSNNAAGSDDDAHMGLDERDLADSKKIMLKLLVQVGSDAKVDRDIVASQQLPALAGAIAGDVEDGLGEYISDTLLACVVGFAHKIDIYAALLGCINEEDGEFAEEVMIKAMKALESAVTSGATRDAKLLLRFISLWPAVRLCSVEQLFGDGCLGGIISACVDAGDNARLQADEAVGAVLLALIWNFKALSEDQQGAVSMSDMISRIQEQYMSRRTASSGKPSAETLLFPDVDSLCNEDGIRSRLECLKNLLSSSRNNANATPLPTILADRTNNVCQLAAQALDEAEAADIPSINLCTAAEWAAPQKSHGRSCTRNVRLFGDGGCEDGATFAWGASYREKTLSGISAADRLCLRDLVLDILATHAPRSDECVAALIRSSFQGAEHIVLESIFVAMLSPPYLPDSCPSWLFYGGIIVRICKASKEYPPTLAETFDVLFEGIAGFSAKDDAAVPSHSTDTNEASAGSSSSICREQLHNLMPHIQNAPTNNYRFPETSSEEDCKAYRNFFDKLRTVFDGPDQASDGNLLDWLQSDDSPLPSAVATIEKGSETDSDELKSAVNKDAKAVHIVTIAILQSGHKTLTHALARVDRFGSLLYKMSRAYGTIEDSGVAIVDACAVFFSDTPHYWFCVIDGLIQREYLSISAFARWILRKSRFEMLAGYHLWNYLQNSVRRAAASYFTRSANSAAAIPRSTAALEEFAGRDKEQMENLYDVFTAFRSALAQDRAGSTEEVQHQKKIIRQHGEVLVAIVKDCCSSEKPLDMSRIKI
eukprot:g4285.t1